MVGAATEKPLEPKQVRTRGTHIGRLGGVDGLVGNAGNVEFDAQVNRKPVVIFEQSR